MKRLLKIISILLIQAFLIMDLGMCAGANIFSKFEDMDTHTLAPKLSISAEQFQQVYGYLHVNKVELLKDHLNINRPILPLPIKGNIKHKFSITGFIKEAAALIFSSAYASLLWLHDHPCVQIAVIAGVALICRAYVDNDMPIFMAVCYRMFYRDEVIQRMQEEWAEREEEPTEEEIADAAQEIDESTQQIDDLIEEIEEAILEDIESDQDPIGSELDDEAIHSLQDNLLKSLKLYIGAGGSSYEEWKLKLLEQLLEQVFIEDNLSALTQLFSGQKINQLLQRIYNLADKNFLHHSPSQKQAPFPIGASLSKLSAALPKIMHNHGHLKSIAWFIVCLGYYLLSADADTAIMSFAVINSLDVSNGDSFGADGLRPKPEIIERMSIDLRETIQERKIKDYYFSSSIAQDLDGIIGRGQGIASNSRIIKNNALLTGINSDLLESVVESIVSRMINERNSAHYSYLSQTNYLMFNASVLVDNLAVAGTIENTIKELVQSLEDYYEDKPVVLVINLQDLYDLGQMEGRTREAVAGIYMRLAPLLESKKITLVGLATNLLAAKLKSEARMMQRLEIIPVEGTKDYQMNEIIHEELQDLNKNYQDKLDDIQIKMQKAEQTELAVLMKSLKTSQEPPRILCDKLESWFKSTFLKKDKLLWQRKYHHEQIEKLIEQYKTAQEYTSILERYMRQWLNYHLEQLAEIEKELVKYEEWFREVKEKKIYWLKAEELIAKEAEWEKKIPGMMDNLTKEVIDQDIAAQAIQRAFNQAVVIHDDEHPIGAFIFAGPTGVGKTEIARALSRYLFGSEGQIVRIDGSEYGQQADMYKLIGPPPAIIGHEQGGILTNEVAKKEFCIVLYDELDKSHADIQDLFLQVIDGARLTDGKGKTVDFKNVILIMTSNLGYHEDIKLDVFPGLGNIEEYINSQINVEKGPRIKTQLEKLLQAYQYLDADGEVYRAQIEQIEKLSKQAQDSSNQVEVNQLAKGYLKDQYADYLAQVKNVPQMSSKMIHDLYAHLNYYRDLDILTAQEHESLEKLWQSMHTDYNIRDRYLLYYQGLVIRALISGEEINIRWLDRIRQIRQLEVKTLQEQINFYLEQMLEEIQSNLRSVIRGRFRQEFLNKLGEENIILFNPLTKRALRKILKLKLAEVNKVLSSDGFGQLILSEEVEAEVLKQGFSPQMGARPLLRSLRQVVLEPLADAKLKKELVPQQDINVSIKEGRTSFTQEKAQEEEKENDIKIKGLLEKVKEDKQIEINRCFELLKVEPLSQQELTSEQEEIDYRIQIKEEQDQEDLMAVDTARLEEFEKKLTEQMQRMEKQIKDLEAQLRMSTESSKQQIIQMQLNMLQNKLAEAKSGLEIINLRKSQKEEDARNLQEKMKEKKASELKQQEEDINSAFENLSLMAQDGELEEQPVDSDVVYEIQQVIKSKYLNDPFLIEPSFIVQRSIVEEVVRRIHQDNDEELKRIRFVRLKLTGLAQYLSLIGYFEARMRDLLKAIHEDDQVKQIRTIVVMDLDEVNEEIERMRANPFLLSFFLRLFHNNPDISFLMTTANNSVTSEEIFNRYFRDVEAPRDDLDKLFESLFICSDEWMKDKDAEDDGLSVISFDIKQRALKIWNQFYSGEPALDLIKRWFSGIKEKRKRRKAQLLAQKDELLRSIASSIKRMQLDLKDEGSRDIRIDDLRQDGQLVNSLEELAVVDNEISELDKAGGVVSKRELDAEILRQERSRRVLAEQKEYEQIDISNIDLDPAEKALSLEATLNEKIFAQEPAIKKVSTAVKIDAAGLRLRNNPIGAFLFGGPTGVGKTETAKQTAKAQGMRYFRIDLSEFQSREDVWRLIGAPKGYVGWDDGEGTFIEWMRKYPNTVILFDEVEKGHPDILNILLQILEDGILTSNRGHRVDFSKSLIFITSNLGVKETQLMADGTRRVSFDMYPEMQRVYRSGDPERIAEFNEKMQERVKKRIKEYFRPELLNRLDAVEVFSPFTQEEVIPIADKLVKERLQKLEQDHYIKLEINDRDLLKASRALAKAGFSPKSGARQMDRISKRWITEAVRPMLNSISRMGDDVRVRCRFEQGRLKFEVEEQPGQLMLSNLIESRLELLFRWLKESKDRSIDYWEVKELIYPIEAKGKLAGKKALFTDAVKKEPADHASPTKKDKNIEQVIVHLKDRFNRLNFKEEVSEDRACKEAVIKWIKEAVGFSKRVNLWRYMWEKNQEQREDYWQLGKKEIKPVYEQYQQDGTLDEKKVEILYEQTQNSFLLGISMNSELGRYLEQELIENNYTDEETIRTSLDKYKSMQGLLVAMLELKKQGIVPEFGLSTDATMLWIKIPVIDVLTSDSEIAEIKLIKDKVNLINEVFIEDTDLLRRYAKFLELQINYIQKEKKMDNWSDEDDWSFSDDHLKIIIKETGLLKEEITLLLDEFGFKTGKNYRENVLITLSLFKTLRESFAEIISLSEKGEAVVLRGIDDQALRNFLLKIPKRSIAKKITPKGWQKIIQHERMGKRIGRPAIDEENNLMFIPSRDRERVIIADLEGKVIDDELLSISGVSINDCFVTKSYLFVATTKGTYIYRKRFLENGKFAFSLVRVINRDLPCDSVCARELRDDFNVFIAYKDTASTSSRAQVAKYNSNERILGKVVLDNPASVWINEQEELIITYNTQAAISEQTYAASVCIVDAHDMHIKHDSGKLILAEHSMINGAVEDNQGLVYIAADDLDKIIPFQRSNEEIEIEVYGSESSDLKEKAIVRKLIMRQESIFLPANTSQSGLNIINGNELILSEESQDPNEAGAVWKIAITEPVKSSGSSSDKTLQAYLDETAVNTTDENLKEILMLLKDMTLGDRQEGATIRGWEMSNEFLDDMTIKERILRQMQEENKTEYLDYRKIQIRIEAEKIMESIRNNEKYDVLLDGFFANLGSKAPELHSVAFEMFAKIILDLHPAGKKTALDEKIVRVLKDYLGEEYKWASTQYQKLKELLIELNKRGYDVSEIYNFWKKDICRESTRRPERSEYIGDTFADIWWNDRYMQRKKGFWNIMKLSMIISWGNDMQIRAGIKIFKKLAQEALENRKYDAFYFFCWFLQRKLKSKDSDYRTLAVESLSEIYFELARKPDRKQKGFWAERNNRLISKKLLQIYKLIENALDDENEAVQQAAASFIGDVCVFAKTQGLGQKERIKLLTEKLETASAKVAVVIGEKLGQAQEYSIFENIKNVEIFGEKIREGNLGETISGVKTLENILRKTIDMNDFIVEPYTEILIEAVKNNKFPEVRKAAVEVLADTVVSLAQKGQKSEFLEIIEKRLEDKEEVELVFNAVSEKLKNIWAQYFLNSWMSADELRAKLASKNQKIYSTAAGAIKLILKNKEKELKQALTSSEGKEIIEESEIGTSLQIADFIRPDEQEEEDVLFDSNVELKTYLDFTNEEEQKQTKPVKKEINIISWPGVYEVSQARFLSNYTVDYLPLLFKSLTGMDRVIELVNPSEDRMTIYESLKKLEYDNPLIRIEYWDADIIGLQETDAGRLKQIQCNYNMFKMKDIIGQGDGAKVVTSMTALVYLREVISKEKDNEEIAYQKLADSFNQYPADVHVHFSPYRQEEDLKFREYMADLGWIVIDLNFTLVFFRNMENIPESFQPLLAQIYKDGIRQLVFQQEQTTADKIYAEVNLYLDTLIESTKDKILIYMLSELKNMVNSTDAKERIKGVEECYRLLIVLRSKISELVKGVPGFENIRRLEIETLGEEILKNFELRGRSTASFNAIIKRAEDNDSKVRSLAIRFIKEALLRRIEKGETIQENDDIALKLLDRLIKEENSYISADIYKAVSEIIITMNKNGQDVKFLLKAVENKYYSFDEKYYWNDKTKPVIVNAMADIYAALWYKKIKVKLISNAMGPEYSKRLPFIKTIKAIAHLKMPVKSVKHIGAIKTCSSMLTDCLEYLKVVAYKLILSELKLRLKDRDENIRVEAIKALEKAFFDMAENQDRFWIFKRVVSNDMENIFGSIAERMKDKNAKVRSAAEETMQNIGYAYVEWKNGRDFTMNFIKGKVINNPNSLAIDDNEAREFFSKIAMFSEDREFNAMAMVKALESIINEYIEERKNISPLTDMLVKIMNNATYRDVRKTAAEVLGKVGVRNAEKSYPIEFLGDLEKRMLSDWEYPVVLETIAKYLKQIWVLRFNSGNMTIEQLRQRLDTDDKYISQIKLDVLKAIADEQSGLAMEKVAVDFYENLARKREALARQRESAQILGEGMITSADFSNFNELVEQAI